MQDLEPLVKLPKTGPARGSHELSGLGPRREEDDPAAVGLKGATMEDLARCFVRWGAGLMVLGLMVLAWWSATGRWGIA